jgi:hypothetical protein
MLTYYTDLRNWISISVVGFPVRPRKEQKTTSFSVKRKKSKQSANGS